MFNLLSDGSGDEDTRSMLDEICRQGAANMLAVALEAEAADYVARHADDLDDNGHRLVVRNGDGKAPGDDGVGDDRGARPSSR